MNYDRKKVSLVLGGGGARGITHIGAIEIIEELGYEIVSIAGTSAGAIVGAMYATGNLPEYKSWLMELSSFDVLRFYDPAFSRNGLIKDENIMKRATELLGDKRIEDLPIRFTAVATDIQNGKEFWFNHGLVINALRASIAIPNIFVPFALGEKVFVDGGVVNPIPVTPTLSDHSDITIAISLNGPRTKFPLDEQSEKSMMQKVFSYFKEEASEDELGYFEIASRSIDMMQESISRFKLAATPPDILIEFPKNLCGVFDFHLAKELIDFGRQETFEQLKTYKTIVQ